MSATSRVDIESTGAKGRTTALYFASGERKLFGWMHLPRYGTAGGPAKMGLVICNPFGYEAVCSHRSVRSVAEAAMAVAVPTLRFDYSGTGDSADLEGDVDQLEVWCQDVVNAVAALRQSTGVGRVCLLGIRLGALLATMAAARCPFVASLIYIAPVLDGERYLRELRITRLAALRASRTPRQAEVEGRVANAGPMEIAGFTLFAATRRALASVDLAAASAAPAADILILDEISLPSAGRCKEVLTALGVHITYLKLSGLFQMAMSPPHLSSVSRAMISAVSEWLVRLGAQAPSLLVTAKDARGTSTIPCAAIVSAPVLQLPGEGPGHQAPVTERPVVLESEVSLFGIVTEPCAPGCGRAVLLLNMGANQHIGGSRIHVSLARLWARRGYVVMRLDLAGLGDSATSPGAPDDEVFPPSALKDMRVAIDFLRRSYSVGHVTLAGLCSGAYHALRSAVAEAPINCIMMVNPVNFFWKKGMNVHELQLAQVVRNPSRYYERIFSHRALKKLLTGQVDTLRILRVYINSLFPLESALRNMARRLRIPLPRDLGRELEQIAARGIQVVFVFSRDDPGIDLLKLEGGSSVARLGERCKIHVIDHGDHVFADSASRSVLENILSDELSALPG